MKNKNITPNPPKAGPAKPAKPAKPLSPEEARKRALKRWKLIGISGAVVGLLLAAGWAVWALMPVGPITRFDKEAHRLLTEQVVKDELKITEDQQEKINQINERRLKVPDWEIKELSENDRDKRQGYRDHAALKALAQVLDKEQMHRLRQIYLQSRGKRAWTDEDVAKELKLSSQQVKDITAILNPPRTQGSRSSRGPGGNANAGDPRAAWEEQRKSTEQKLLDVLTPAQQNHWEAMQGSVFEGLAQLRSSRFGGFGGRGPGGPPGGGRGGPPF